MRVGITGHQKLGDLETILWIRSQIEKEISSNIIDVGYTCLALGADQLLADILLEKHIPFIAVIPCKNYKQTFEANSLEKYNLYLHHASKYIELEYEQPSEKAFLEASKYLVDHCDYLIAVWNGLPARGLGGTADVVKYALKNQKSVLQLNPIYKTINTL